LISERIVSRVVVSALEVLVVGIVVMHDLVVDGNGIADWRLILSRLCPLGSMRGRKITPDQGLSCIMVARASLCGQLGVFPHFPRPPSYNDRRGSGDLPDKPCSNPDPPDQ
jgi:hypothetical protein